MIVVGEAAPEHAAAAEGAHRVQVAAALRGRRGQGGAVPAAEDGVNCTVQCIQYRCTQYCTGVDLLRGRDRGRQGASGRRHLHPLAGLSR